MAFTFLSFMLWISPNIVFAGCRARRPRVYHRITGPMVCLSTITVEEAEVRGGMWRG